MRSLRALFRFGSTGVLAAALTVTGASALAGPERVDLQLLFAIDVSPSVDSDEYALQIHGVASALRDPSVVAAISTAAPSGVALALMQWAGPREQDLSLSWSQVTDQASLAVFADKVDALVRPATNGGTAIGDALARGISLFVESGFKGTRRVIDVSGDGSTNIGDSPAPVRFQAASEGIVINGLVILNEEPRLADYYQKRVIGGPGAFLLQVGNFEDFADAMRLKLLREIGISLAMKPARPAE